MKDKQLLRRILMLQFAFLFMICALLLYWNVFDSHNPHQSPRAVAAATLWTGTATPVKLVDAEIRAGNMARTWATDAVLTRVETTWRPVGEWRYAESPPVDWSFYYYSPAQRAVKAVAVHENQILPTAATTIPNTPLLLERFPPTQDVSVIWLTFRAAGGDSFLREHARAAVQLRLQMIENRPTWVVLAFTPVSYTHLTLPTKRIV